MQDFFDAIKAGDAAKAGALVDADSSLLEARDGSVTPVLLALYNGKRDIARLLVERGAKLSFPEACAIGDAALVGELLDADASRLDERSADGYPALGLAIFFGQPDIARLLIERGADVNAAAENKMRVAPLHAAAAVCDHATIRLLLEHGADPNATQQEGYTPLHTAGARGDRAMAELLLAHGAHRNVRESGGLGAAEVAEKYGKAEFAAWFRSLT